VLALLGVQIAFASLSIVGKVTVAVVPAVALVTFRLVGATAMFALASFATGRPLIPPREVRGEVITLALTGLVANQLLFVEGVGRSSAVEASVIGATIPVFTLLYAVLSGREKNRVAMWAGVAMALAGVMLVAKPSGVAAHGSHAIGNVMLLLNCVSYSVYLVRGRALLARYGAATVLPWMFGAAVIMVAPFGVGVIALHAAHWSARTWMAIAYVVAVPTAFAYGANAWALARAPSSLVAVFIYVQPAMAIAMAVTFGNQLAAWLSVTAPNEHMTALTAVGMLAVFAGVFVASRR
jgi:drug/metabolite transporter (DMT)-like permease